LQALKQKVARALLRKRRSVADGQLSLPFEGRTRDQGLFWQRRFYDFNVWSEKKLKEKLEYMHANPVQRKLVQHPRDWPWSSWAHYAGRGESNIRIDSDRGDNGEVAASRKRQNPHPYKRRVRHPQNQNQQYGFRPSLVFAPPAAKSASLSAAATGLVLTGFFRAILYFVVCLAISPSSSRQPTHANIGFISMAERIEILKARKNDNRLIDKQVWKGFEWWCNTGQEILFCRGKKRLRDAERLRVYFVDRVRTNFNISGDSEGYGWRPSIIEKMQVYDNLARTVWIFMNIKSGNSA
jgi:hypothetical protein